MPTAATNPTSKEQARHAHLRYTSDEGDGIHRRTRGRTLVYENGHGPIRDCRQLKRIAALGIPPAWTDVWICPDARGHLQATGRDARSRKQYIYHADWNAHTSRTKFSKLRAFGLALPKLRAQVRRDLAKPGLPEDKVVAAVIALLDGTLIRVGNEEYARSNGSYGLTTLRDRHAHIHGQIISLRFKGKSGKLRKVDFYDRRLAKIVRACQDLPGQQLFQYSNDAGAFHLLESSDVNRYLRRVAKHSFTAKEFRTWKASALMLELLSKAAVEPLSPAAAKQHVRQAFREVAEALANTVTVCRKYYVHPQIIELFLAGELTAACGRADARASGRLQLYERLLLKLLRRFELRRARG